MDVNYNNLIEDAKMLEMYEKCVGNGAVVNMRSFLGDHSCWYGVRI